MATINPPISHTTISTTDWGIPVTNQVNANTAQIATNVTNIAANTSAINAAKPTAWVNLTLINGWVNSSGNPAQYRKIGDIVYLRGRIQSGTMLNNCFVLPVGFRPLGPLQFSIASADAGGSWVFGLVEVNADGNTAPRAGTNVAITLHGINFSTIL